MTAVQLHLSIEERIMKIIGWVLLCLFVLSGCAAPQVRVTFAVRPPEGDCPAGNALPPLCLKGAVVDSSCVEIGDVNGDGQVNLGDLVILEQYVLGTKCPDNWIYVDMNDDGQLNAADILLLQKVVL
jgi:hypothetical protein